MVRSQVKETCTRLSYYYLVEDVSSRTPSLFHGNACDKVSIPQGLRDSPLAMLDILVQKGIKSTGLLFFAELALYGTVFVIIPLHVDGRGSLPHARI